MKKLLISAVLALPVISHAGIIDLSISAQQRTNCENEVGLGGDVICNQLYAELDNAINKKLPDANIDEYAKGISDASSVAGAGTSDYSDIFEYFVIKPSFGLGVDSENLSSPEKAKGVGFTGNLVFGVNLNLLPVDKLGFIEFKKMDLFLNYFTFNLDYDIGDGAFTGDINSFGIMARYHIYEPQEGWDEGMFQWSGIFVHTGFQTTSSNLDFSTPIKLDQGVDVGNGVTGNVKNANAAFGIENSVTRIPIEVSTYAKVLYAFTLYGGLGFDITSGTTDIDLKSAGDLTVNNSSADIGTLTMDETSSGEPEATNFRAFLGTQLNLPYFRLYGQFQKPFGQDSIGVNAGLKIIW